MKLQAHDIRALKGKRQLTELNCFTPEQAAAAQEAGIEMIVSGWKRDRAAIRTAAPATHYCFGLIHGDHASAEAALRDAFEGLNAGADSIYCAMHYDVVAALAREGIPVVGHVGFVPQKARMTGTRAFGKTAAEARAVMDAVRRYEDAGAFAIEMEIVAASVATAITRATPLTVISMGSGAGCDVQYLFAIDVLGETAGRVPRHARVYDDFRSEYARLHARRVAAFRHFRTDVDSGLFPAAAETVTPAIDEALAAFLANPRDPDPAHG
jgi:3-methyl-2-oxobutanoate hydroxymethyltransferase